MKRIVVLSLCVATLLFMLTGCTKTEQNIVFTGTLEEILDNSVLVSTSDKVGFDKAVVSFSPGLKFGFNLVVGQILKFTILPQIAESYPVQVTAVAIELVAEPALPDPEHADYTVSFYRADTSSDGGWDFIAKHAVNADTLAISSIRHIPVISIEDANALDDFINNQFNVSTKVMIISQVS